MSTTLGRARPLTRDERRAAIVQATIPLVVEHGASVTTRQIARAADVAEGTLFRVFEDKREILCATVLAAIDPEPLVRELGAVDTSQPLLVTVTRIVELLGARQRTAMRVLSAAHHILGAPGRGDEQSPERGGADARTIRDDVSNDGRHGHGAHHGDARARSTQVVVEAVAERLARHEDQLRMPPETAARVLVSLVVANSLPIVTSTVRLDTQQIVDAVLHGIDHPARGPDAPG